jgi:acetylornithine deacetylase/succinyl-diaminopimelate desuccinylase-like protein
MSLDPTLAHIDANLDGSIGRLFELLRVPSISTDPAFNKDIVAAADLVAKDLASIGFEVSVRPTARHPVVIGHWTGPVEREAPQVLFYGHYDVQPVDPLALWQRPPFQPAIVKRDDGSEMIVARGAADDKGQLTTFVEACRAFVAASGKLPVRVSILLEGEEEIGSPSLHEFLEANKAELSKDIALVCDTKMWDPETPAITATLRGLCAEEVIVRCSTCDLHSGHFGGAALNPIRVLAKILNGLQDEYGACTLPGFYDGIADPPKAVKSSWEALGLTPASFLGQIGMSELAGEEGRSVLEQIWTRPTCEINGIVGGYAGDGFKTVLPANATAKVSFRLVVGQNPEKIRDSFRAYVIASLPKDAQVEFKNHSLSPGLALPFDSPVLKKVKAALTEEWGKSALTIGSGATIPVVGNFKHQLGMDSVLVGFGLTDDRVHSPNEKYDLKSFTKGIRSWARILAAL